MYGKKQRIISFLMAFLLIFTFAFISPLTVSQSQAFAIPALTPAMGRIITGVLVSAGYIIHEGTTASADYDTALIDMSKVIYQTLDNAQKILLGTLSIIDNVVEVPTALYNSIVNKANSLLRTSDTCLTLVEQGIEIKFMNTSSTNIKYPKLSIPIYKYNAGLHGMSGIYTERKLDLREAQPYFIYKGVDNAKENKWYEEGIEYYFLNVFGDDTVSALDNGNIFLTPDMSSYDYKLKDDGVMYNFLDSIIFGLGESTEDFDINWFIDLDEVNMVLNDYIIYSYFVDTGNTYRYTVTDIYDKATGVFVQQIIKFITQTGSNNGILSITSENSPIIYDISLIPDTTIVPPVTNSIGDNVITLPSTLSDTIGATSTDVNVGTSDIPDNPDVSDTPDTETMDNINTNVGELVTGGTLGEQVNTNIGSVEGLHGEITEQVDFGAVFDTIAQYISSLDISSVTWFPTAVASFLVPFLPVISLGLILFFIDRVLNGGA